MEASVIAAVVSAAGTLLAKSLELFAGNRDSASQDPVDGVVDQVYETLRTNMSGGCVRLLRMLESGSLYYPAMLRQRFYPALDASTEHMTAVDSEFRYRLEYLRQNGVLTLVAGGEYGISRLGLGFLSRARRQRDYYKELFDE